MSDRQLLGLVCLRLYLTQSLLAYLFGLDESNLCRERNQRVLPALLLVLPTPLRDAPLRASNQEAAPELNPEKPRRRIRTLQELLCAYPELKEVRIDATEQEVPKPQEQEPRKVRYWGKKKEHTVKTQVMTTRTQILHGFGGLPGSLHDRTLLRASGVLHPVPPKVKARLDCGYEGVETQYPNLVVEKPVRARRAHRVRAPGRAYNQMVSRLRIPVEQVLSRLKKLRVLADVFRGSWERHEDLFCVVRGIVNYKATGKFRLV